MGFPAFFQCEDALRSMATWRVVFNPARRDSDAGFDPTGLTGHEDLAELNFDLAAAMAADLDFIVNRAEAICLLPGWEFSTGALHEKRTAELLDLQVFYYQPKLAWPFTADPAGTVPCNGWQLRDGAEPAEEETRVTNATTGGQKGSKLERYDLIPVEPLAEVSRVYGRGAAKYAPRNWEKGYDWSLSYAALQRHVNLFWAGVDFDGESGQHHLAHAVFHCLALMEWRETHPEMDDRS
jgi:hypothetical protein